MCRSSGLRGDALVPGEYLDEFGTVGQQNRERVKPSLVGAIGAFDEVDLQHGEAGRRRLVR